MAVKIRKSRSKINECYSCESNGGKFYDLGFGPEKSIPRLIVLCDTCMHSLLQKMIIIGQGEQDGVR